METVETAHQKFVAEAWRKAAVLATSREHGAREAELHIRLPLAFEYMQRVYNFHECCRLDFEEFEMLPYYPTYNAPPPEVVDEIMSWLDEPNALAQYPELQRSGSSDLHRLIQACRTAWFKRLRPETVQRLKFHEKLVAWQRLLRVSTPIGIPLYASALFGLFGATLKSHALDFLGLAFLAWPLALLCLIAAIIFMLKDLSQLLEPYERYILSLGWRSGK